MSGLIGISRCTRVPLSADRTTRGRSELLASICTALHCTPFDLWPPAAVADILRVYPAELWPHELDIGHHQSAPPARTPARPTGPEIVR